MPKFKVKMSWLDTYEKVIEAPTKEEAIAEAERSLDKCIISSIKH